MELPALAGKKVLDLGVGFGRWAHFIRSEPDRGGLEAWIIGCDIFKPYLLAVKRFNIYDELVFSDLKYLPFKYNSFNIAIAVEVLEHLDKKDGIRFIRQLKNMATEKIILTTPNRFLPQEDRRLNPHEIHRSGWTVSELRGEGFNVKGIGFKINLTSLRWKSLQKLFWILIEMLSPLSIIFPQFGEFLLATIEPSERGQSS